ncbi:MULTISPECIES: helix-turn-helix domain-containing protein [Acinetobacter calcoaceticus/baumannii complex]|uniref:helix-turn-helix domain-containing protein n=1 Tax=Acinetobacter calcoaceticus/baumannii complex TaxID=909768 RepID=UPI002446A678|nr:helix-turn-helix transcriptional regulator [Acinetobacter baumannii]MDH2481117.1 helix-turn-helix transcriptional regulator [Acinetobacter baumannii]MDH2502153.1 helix-turn-helix transcriptional regulator [Acinetobacter baumannii]MDV7664704.1 helix-turn-helix transcriptional regulator [Acinetobacter baumannii]
MIHRTLKAIRKFHGISQAELASELNISKSYLCELEAGKKSVSYTFLEEFSRYFDIPTSSLVYLSENIENPEKISKKFKLFATSKLINILEWIGEKKLKDNDDDTEAKMQC